MRFLHLLYFINHMLTVHSSRADAIAYLASIIANKNNQSIIDAVLHIKRLHKAGYLNK